MREAGLAAALLAALAPALWARPNLDAPRPVGSLTVYEDDQRPGLFFYGPGELAMAEGPDGKPDFHFMQMRYTGTAVHGDRGTALHRSILGFRVSMRAPSAADLASARQALARGRNAVELRPLPIRRLEAAVIYAPAGVPEDKAAPLPEGHFEDGSGPNDTGKAFWTTRSFALGLDPQSSELFGGALAKGQLVLSMSYAFYSTGSGPPAQAEELVGPPRAVRELKRLLASRPAVAPATGAARDRLVRAGAFSVSVDTGKWPDLVRRVDVNERVPPGYPLLDVYCYDFNASLHPALYEKQVHVEAQGVGGGPVSASARFGRDQPDLYAHSLRFGVAVRLDRPYRYRVTEVRDDGTSAVTPWRERTSWSELLDVTTPADPAAPPEPLPGEEQ